MRSMQSRPGMALWAFTHQNQTWAFAQLANRQRGYQICMHPRKFKRQTEKQYK